MLEPADRLGESLVLIGDLEDQRAELEQRFPVLAKPGRVNDTRSNTGKDSA
ncbi:MAG: hypothetical protein QOG33_1364 [Gaiellales bacterium]|nr:hypothetical protein [Gaiellales bacterium]